MYVLLACSVVALAIALERLYNLLRAQNDADKLIGAVKRHLNQGRFLEALKFAKQERGPIAAVLAAGIQNYGRDLNEVERNMNLVAEQELYRMRKDCRPCRLLQQFRRCSAF